MAVASCSRGSLTTHLPCVHTGLMDKSLREGKQEVGRSSGRVKRQIRVVGSVDLRNVETKDMGGEDRYTCEF